MKLVFRTSLLPFACRAISACNGASTGPIAPLSGNSYAPGNLTGATTGGGGNGGGRAGGVITQLTA